ncbi:MAG TPA: hypothetical protein VFP72_03660 [Kineosporiaceae bacterium]|nr:hypothetical protein [Kineosporiaceae bacterium]
MSGMRMRLVGVACGWTAVASLATAVSWAGVGLVGNEVSPAGPAALSQAEVQRRIQSVGPSAGQTPPPAAVRSGTAPATTPAASGEPDPRTSGSVGSSLGTDAQRSVVTRGGTVVLSCSGNRISARWSASPGYVMNEEPKQDPSKVKIEFGNGTLASTVRASCAAGLLTVSAQDGRADD